MRLDLPPNLLLPDIMPLTAQLQVSIARHALLGAYYMGARLFLSPHMHDAWHKIDTTTFWASSFYLAL